MIRPAAQTAGPNAAPACPRTGHWSDCQLRLRLEQSGLAPRTTHDKVGDLPSLSVPATTLMLGNAGLAYYVFSDTLLRHGAAASLDTVHFIPQSKPLTMHGETTVIQNDNLLVLLFSHNEHQRERVSDAVTAGAPQP